MAVDYKLLGTRIKEARKQKGYTQKQLADAISISQQHIGNIETGANKLSLQALVDIADALDTTADALLCDNLVAVESPYYIELKQLFDSCNEQEKLSVLRFIEELLDILHNKKA